MNKKPRERRANKIKSVNDEEKSKINKICKEQGGLNVNSMRDEGKSE